MSSHSSPDGAYIIEIYAYKVWFSAPGDSGQGEGYVLLRNKDGDILEEKESDGVGVLDTIRWRSSDVEIKQFVTWTLR